MKKTYVTTMPDHVGAFLKASRCMAALGLNITRVSYNKAIDIHTLFVVVILVVRIPDEILKLVHNTHYN